MDQNGNPFRPGGVLSKEADEIVNLIKQGKPISPSASPICDKSSSKDNNNKEIKEDQTDSLKKKNKKDKKKNKNEIEEVEVNKSIIQDKQASYAEQVDLPVNDKKKKDSLCCVIQ